MLAFAAPGNEHQKENSLTRFHGNQMLVISVPKYKEAVDEYLKWKKSRGLKVEADFTSATKGAEAVKARLKDKFNNTGLTFVIIIGDIEDVPSPYYMGAPSDPSYVLLEGDDYIGDALISRIPAKNPDECRNILNKIIFYEKGNFKDTDWIDNAIVVGTHEFDGIAHTTGIAKVMKEKADYFDEIFQILETDQDTQQTLFQTIENHGAHMIVYNSHGSPDGFHNIVFTNKDIPKLSTFHGSFPFFHGAGCSTGSFHLSSGDCFAEALLKTGTLENPYGPIAVLAFSRSANPGPAMMAQREAFKKLYYDKNIRTYGELCYYSNLYAMENFNAYEAEKFYKHWHLFGDCSTPIWKHKT